MMVLRFGKAARCSVRKLRQFQVSKFCDRLIEEKAVSKGMIFTKPSSVILFLMSLRLRDLVLGFMSSQSCKQIASPSYALVKSTVSTESARTPSIIFSYFSGSLMALIFFLTAQRGITSFFYYLETYLCVISSFVIAIGLFFGTGLEEGVPLVLGRVILVGVVFSSLIMLSLRMLLVVKAERLWFCQNSSTSYSRLSSSSCAYVLTRFLMFQQEISQLANSFEFSFSAKALPNFFYSYLQFSQSSTTFGKEVRQGVSLKKTPSSSTNLLTYSVDLSYWCLRVMMISLPLSISPLPLRQKSRMASLVPDWYELNLFSAAMVQDSQILMVFQSRTSHFLIFRSTFYVISYSL